MRPAITFLSGAALAAGVLAAPATAAPELARVTMLAGAFSPRQVNVLAGDTVAWRNGSLRAHTVYARDGSFASDRLSSGSVFTHTFERAGSVAYYCSLHPFMTGEVDAHNLLLRGPSRAVVKGSSVALTGRAIQGPRSATIERDVGSGFTAVGTVLIGDDGSFGTTMSADRTAVYRASAGAFLSPRLRVAVIEHAVLRLTAFRARRGATLKVRVRPAYPGTVVVLQLRLRERFGWWPVSRTRLNHASRARFGLRRRRPVRARVVLTGPDGATPLAVSNVVRVRARR